MTFTSGSISGPAKPAVSVVICTKDPRADIFARTLDSIEQQTLDKDLFELIVVDNNCSPALDVEVLKGNRLVAPILVREPVQGLSRARCAGIVAARGDLLVFVDDDNFLARDYLEQAICIARAQERVGLFGGIAVAELESPIPAWKKVLLPYMGVKDYGPAPITAFADHWGEWEPIGAGMVARREVAEKFVEMLRTRPGAMLLGRNGTSLLSGEDSLFARAAHRVGYSCSYQPALRLTHYIKKSRLQLKYMVKLMEGHGRSYVLLNRAVEKDIDPLKMRTAVCRLLYRVWNTGRAGFITWFWDIGYARERGGMPNTTIRSKSVREEHAGKDSTTMKDDVTPLVSVILCTRDPRPDLLARTLDSLERQTLPRERFEVVVVDNNSSPPVSEQHIQEKRAQSLRVIYEARSGHIFARRAGIAAAAAELLLFVDDDNFMAADYLERAVQIAKDEPTIGAFGGIAEPELEFAVSEWKKPLMLYLAIRDHGDKPITSFDDHWGEWEPIGAGMVVRRDVARKFVDMLENLPGADRLGRTKRGLMSGDDSLFSRAAHRLGYACSYQPALRLTHHIKGRRLRLKYLARLLMGHGRTHVILQSALGRPVPEQSLWSALKLIPFRYRQNGGAAGLVIWFWDLGYTLQRRKHRDAMPLAIPRLETESRHHA